MRCESDDLTKPKTAERAEPWDAHILQGHARPTRGWPAVVDFHSERSAMCTPLQRVWRFKGPSVGKIKDKKKVRSAEHRECIAFDCLDKVGKMTERELSRGPRIEAKLNDMV